MQTLCRIPGVLSLGSSQDPARTRKANTRHAGRIFLGFAATMAWLHRLAHKNCNQLQFIVDIIMQALNITVIIVDIRSPDSTVAIILSLSLYVVVFFLAIVRSKVRLNADSDSCGVSTYIRASCEHRRRTSCLKNAGHSTRDVIAEY